MPKSKQTSAKKQRNTLSYEQNTVLVDS